MKESDAEGEAYWDAVRSFSCGLHALSEQNLDNETMRQRVLVLLDEYLPRMKQLYALGLQKEAAAMGMDVPQLEAMIDRYDEGMRIAGSPEITAFDEAVRSIRGSGRSPG